MQPVLVNRRTGKRGIIVYWNRNCIQQSLFNRDTEYRHLGLQPVAGSLGIGETEPFYEYGGSYLHTYEDYRQYSAMWQILRNTGPFSWNVHVWLQDSAGSVYDVVSQSMVNSAAVHNKKLHLDWGDVIEAGCPDLLRAKGLHYKPAEGGGLIGELLGTWGPTYAAQKLQMRDTVLASVEGHDVDKRGLIELV